MKSKLYLFLVVLCSAAWVSCSEDDEKPRKGDTVDITHEGEKWSIVSVDYTLTDQEISSGGINQTFKSDTKANAGFFYFIDGEGKGSFEMNIEGYNKEDSFSFTMENEGIDIFHVEQSVGVQTNQNVIALNGSTTETEMTLSGLITKQNPSSGQFVLQVEMLLEKQ